jgi:fibronectin-binding autotransporter adhesin
MNTLNLSLKPVHHGVVRSSSRLRARRWLQSLGLFTAMASLAGPVLGQGIWDGNADGDGDNLLWNDPLNWDSNTVPASNFSVLLGGASGYLEEFLHLNGNQSANNIYLDGSSGTVSGVIGGRGNSSLLTLLGSIATTSSNLSLGDANVMLTVNAPIYTTGGVTAGLMVSGQATNAVHLTNIYSPIAPMAPAAPFGGSTVGVHGGVTLMLPATGLTPRLAGTGVSLNNRSDLLVLGGPSSGANRKINLTSGGVLAIYGSGYNPDGNTKDIVLGNGGGALAPLAGFQQWTLDDAGQISGVGNLTKAGNGRLTLTTQAYLLTGDGFINAGVLDNAHNAANGTQLNRFTGFTQTGTLTVGTSAGSGPRGMYVLNNGTAGNLDRNTVLNKNGILGVQGADHQFGVFSAANAIAPASSTLTVNGVGGVILGRDAFTPQTQRLPRINAAMVGSGTIDFQPSTNAGGTSRVVFQRSDVPHTFTGTVRILENGTLESQARNSGIATTSGTGTIVTYDAANLSKINSGNAIGGSTTVELAGFNSGLDVRDNAGATTIALGIVSAYNRNTLMTDYVGNTIKVSSTTPGGIQRLSTVPVVIPTASGTATAGHIANFPAGSAPDGNIFHFGTIELTGSQWLQTNAGNNYSTRVNNLVLGAGATPWIDIGVGNIRVVNAVTAGTTNLVKRGSAELQLDSAATLGSLDIRHGNLRLQNGGSLAVASNTVVVNGGQNPSGTNFGAGGLVLDNGGTLNGNRIPAGMTVEMKGNSALTFTSLSGSASSETIDTVKAINGGVTLTATRTGAETSALTITALDRGMTPNSTVNFAGTSLGTAATGVGQIFVSSLTATTPATGTSAGLIGGWATVGGDWAKYGANGVTALVASDYDTTATLASGVNANPTALLTVPGGGASAQSLRLAQAAGTTGAPTGIATNGQLLRIESGGILSSTTAGQGISGTVVGGLTQGAVNDVAGNLYIHTAADLRLSALVQNNGTGATTLVKGGAGTLFLIPQHLGGSTNAAPFTPATTGAVIVGAYPSQPFTGGFVINQGSVNVWRNELLGTGPITLAGGALELNHPVTGTNNTTNLLLPGLGMDVTVTANSSLGIDNNAETPDGTAGNNNLAQFGKLTIKAGQELAIGGFNANDIRFNNGAVLEPGSAFVPMVRDASSNFVFNGEVSGSAPVMLNPTITGGNPQTGPTGSTTPIVLGGGAADNVANTFTGTTTIYNGTVRLNKANGTTAMTGDVLINGGALAWGGPMVLGRASFAGWGQNEYDVASSTFKIDAGFNQIADTANITMLSGALGDNNRVNIDTFANLTMRGGTFNPGVQRTLNPSGTGYTDNTLIITDTLRASGGNIVFNSGTHLAVNRIILEDGAPNLNIANNLFDANNPTILEVGAGGLELNGHSVIISQGGTVNGAGAQLKLGGNVTVNTSVLNAGSYTHTLAVQTGASFRELNDNSFVDFTGGNRTFTIAPDAFFTASAILKNGSLTKAGSGALAIEPFKQNTLTGLTINDGIVYARGGNSLGSGATVVVNNGGTLKLENHGANDFNYTVSGDGAVIARSDTPTGTGVKWEGALISEAGSNQLNGSLAISGDAKIGAAATAHASVAGIGVVKSLLDVASAGGVTGTGNLTVAAEGDVLIRNGVNTVGTLTKTGNGRLEIAGASTYAGMTDVQGGSLLASHSAALGTPAGGTRVLGGAQLILGSGVTTAESLTLNGTGLYAAGGALRLSGAAISGAIALQTSSSISTDVGTASSLFGAISTVAPSATGADLTLQGAGAGGSFAAMNLGTGILRKEGLGTWGLFGANTSTGGIQLNGGDLMANGAALPSGALSLGGGKLILSSGSYAPTSTTIGSGGGDIDVAAGATADLGALTLGTGASARFGAVGTINATATLVGGMVPRASMNGTDLANITGGQIVPVTSYIQSKGEVLTAGTENVSAPVGLNVTGAGNNLSVNALRIGGGVGVAASGGIVLAGSTIVNSSPRNAGIDTGGTNALSSAGSLAVITSGDIDISSKLAPAGGSLIKDGLGRLTLSGDNSVGLTGDIFVNGGTLAIVGPNGTAHPTALGAATARNLNLNGGAFSVLTGDYDPNLNTTQVVIGAGGGELNVGRGQLMLNDATQLSGSGDLVKSGGGRLLVGGAGTGYGTFGTGTAGFSGTTTVTGGALVISHQAALGNLPGGNQITMKPGTVLINSNGTNNVPGSISLNSLVLDNAEFSPAGGDRNWGGDITLIGTNQIPAREHDNPGQNRSPLLTGRVTQSASGVLNVSGVNNNSALQLNGNNAIVGTINLGANAALFASGPASIGTPASTATVNLTGPNARLFLRNDMNGDYNVNVNLSNRLGFAELTAGRVNANGGGSSQIITIKDLSLGTKNYVSVSGDNSMEFTVKGTTTIGADTVVSTPGNNLWTMGPVNVTPGTSGIGVDKRGAGTSWIASGPINNTGTTLVQQGFLILRSDAGTAGGSLPDTTKIDLRGGEFRVENTNGGNANRINDAAQIVLGGGVFRLSGTETVLGASVSAPSGQTSVIYNQETAIGVGIQLTLPGFTRSTGATVFFGSDAGTVGAALANNALGNTAAAQTQPRIYLPGQVDSTGNTILPWAVVGSDFANYSNSVLGGGAAEFSQVRGLYTGVAGRATNPTATSTNGAEITGASTIAAASSFPWLRWNTGTAATTTVNGAMTLTQGGLLQINTAAMTVAGTGSLTSGTSELIFQSTNTGQINMNIPIVGAGVSLVKGGSASNIIQLGAANTFGGNVYINSGQLQLTAAGSLPSTATVFLAGGELSPNFTTSTAWNNPIVVNASSLITADNGSGGAPLHTFGGITFNGSYELSLSGWDGADLAFTGGMNLNSHTPTLVMLGGRTGGPTGLINDQNNTIGGKITGTGGFRVMVAGTENAITARTGTLVIGSGAGDVANDYAGPTQILSGRVQLNKPAGVTAITADADATTYDFEIFAGNNQTKTVNNTATIGSYVQLMADNQIADAANVRLVGGRLDLNGKAETIQSLRMDGGHLITGAATLNITGNVDLMGTGLTTDSSLVVSNTQNGFEVSAGGNAVIGGNLVVGEYGRMLVNPTNGGTGRVTVNGTLNLTGGNTFTNNAANSGGGTIRLNTGATAAALLLKGDVTTNASPLSAAIDGANDTDNYLELNGVRSFTIADGSAGDDFIVSAVITNDGVNAGGITKNGAGTMLIGNTSAVANTYTGGTTVNAGWLDLGRTAGVTAIPGTVLTIDNAGVRLRASNQIADTVDVVMNANSTLDLDTFANASETVKSLASAASSSSVLLGNASVLTINGGSAKVFAGSISGNGSVALAGVGTKLDLTGMNNHAKAISVATGSTLAVNGQVHGAQVTVDSGAILMGSGIISTDRNAADPAVVLNGAFKPGNSPGIVTTGTVNVGATGSIQFEVAGLTAGSLHDQLNINGFFNLDAASTISVVSSGTYAIGDKIYIVLNDGADPVNGMFAGFAEGAPVVWAGAGNPGTYTWNISYVDNGDAGMVANDISLTLIPEPVSFSLLSLGGLLVVRRRRR